VRCSCFVSQIKIQNEEAETGSRRGPQTTGRTQDLKAVMSLRMPQDLRDQLERARQASGRSLSQELLARARLTFDRDRDLARDPAMRAFCFLFSQIVESVPVKLKGEPEWRFDPWLFQTVKLAITKLLDRFQPTGEVKRSEYWQFFRDADMEGYPITKEERARITESPETMADFAVRRLLADFSNPEQIGNQYKKGKGLVEKFPERQRPIMRDLVRSWETTYYGMTDAQRDLAPREKSRGRK
jgi:hypothetical protein